MYSFLVHSLVWNMSEKERRYLEKTVAEELEVIREVDKKEISKNKIA